MHKKRLPKTLSEKSGAVTKICICTFWATLPPDPLQLHLGHADPLLQQPRPLLAAQLGGPQTGRQHRVSQTVELPHGGPDRPANVLPALLVPLGPERAQAVVRNQAHKQLLMGGWGRGGVRGRSDVWYTLIYFMFDMIYCTCEKSESDSLFWLISPVHQFHSGGGVTREISNYFLKGGERTAVLSETQCPSHNRKKKFLGIRIVIFRSKTVP